MTRSTERGISIVLVALLLVPLLLFAGLAVDLGGWYARAAAIQRAADAAALAGVALMANGDSAAIAEARRVATLNGFTDGVAGITVDAERLPGTPRLLVEITDTDVDRYLSSPFRSQVTIRRRATAEQVPLVPMGGPFNFLGTNDPSESPERLENFWLSVSGYCAYREHGDRITPRGDAQRDPGGAFAGCEPGVAGVRANPDFVGRYFFGVTFGSGGGSQTLEIFDGPYCDPGSAGDDSGDESEQQYRIRVRGPGPDPTRAPVLDEQTLTATECSSDWATVYEFGETLSGMTYYFEVEPLEPDDLRGPDAQEGQNRFALRVREGESFIACSTADGEPHYSATCNANIFALTHLGLQATIGSDSSFYLVDVGPEHNGKTMTVELFDIEHEADAIELIPPTADPQNQSPMPVQWEVACMDGSYRSDNGGSCRTATGEIAPPGGYGPFLDTTIDVSGASDSYRPWGARNSQRGRYNDRTLRLRLELPDNIETTFGGRTWWRIRYTLPSATPINDRTTWSVFVEGDPVRLVPNS